MLIQPAPPAGNVSGKAALTSGTGCVFFLWRGQQAARVQAIPSNPGSEQQTVVRSNLTLLSQRWRDTLDDTQRAGWTSYANTHHTTDRLGRPVRPTGLNAYIQLNSITQLRAGTQVDTAPSTPLPGAVTSLVLSDSDEDLVMTVTHNQPTLTGMFLMIRANDQVSFTRRVFERAVPLATTASANSFQALTATDTVYTFVAGNLRLRTSANPLGLAPLFDAQPIQFVASIVNASGQEGQRLVTHYIHSAP